MAASQEIRWKNGNQPLCPGCEGVELRRQGRVGLWQRVILPWMGLYPWECGLCRRIYMLRQRSSGYTSPSTPAVRPVPSKDQKLRQSASDTQAKNSAVGEQATGTTGFPPRQRSR